MTQIRQFCCDALGVLKSLVLLTCLASGGVRAAEFLYDGGVVVAGSQNVILRINDQYSAELISADAPLIEYAGNTINLYFRVTLNPATSSGLLHLGGDLGVMPEPKTLTVNYYLSTRVLGGQYSDFQLRKSEALVVMSVGEKSQIVEYYHDGLQHYFITSNIFEIEKLDTGVLAGWARTGVVTVGYTSLVANPLLSPTCRYYGLPSAGLNTHFYSNSLQECAHVSATWPTLWVEETPRAFDVIHLSPETQSCPVDTVKAIRFFNGKADVNHRYVVTVVAETEMTAKGWIREGGVWCTKITVP